MKKTLSALLTLLFLAACTPNSDTQTQTGTETPSTVNSFEDCVAAGNPVMESYPRQCRHEDQLFVESVELPGSEENTQACTKEFMPVCGEVQVQCIKAPCEPLKTTFGNRCEAENAGATNITEGACQDEAPNPEGACLSFDGKWIAETQECEGMGQEQCTALGGTFNECASACRNEPEGTICTMQCVLVCQL